jgi:hypothetical protein
MNRRRLTLIEVLQPQCFTTTPERARVTRTILQPEVDAFELMEAQASANEKLSTPARRGNSAATQITPPQSNGLIPMPPQLTHA